MRKRGFTLVEIMIVVAIIALLAAIAIPNLLNARKTANDAAAKATVRSLSTAAETYATSYSGNYPTGVGVVGPPATLLTSFITSAPNYCNATFQGFTYTCDLASTGYTFTATPTASGGTTTYTCTTGGVLAPL